MSRRTSADSEPQIQRDKVVYYVKRPNSKGRATFAIIKKITHPDGKIDQPTLKSERVTALNKALKTGTLDRTTVEMEVQSICNGLNAEEQKRTQGVWVSSDGNLKLLNDYWAKKYEDTEIVTPEREWYALKRAVDNLGPLSLLGDPKTIRAAIKARNPRPNEQRRYLGKINCLRKFHGINEDIKPPEAEPPACRYLTEPEFLKALSYVENDLCSIFFKTLFYTGVRVGEALFLNPECVNGRLVSVSRQIRRDGKIGKRKNKKPYVGIVLPNGVSALNDWVNSDDHNDVPRGRVAKILTAACMKAFPNQPRKWLTAHDLRHCFAIMLLTKHQLNISTVARLIGDSVIITEKYYASFIQNDDFTNSVLATTS
jgi:integrase